MEMMADSAKQAWEDVDEAERTKGLVDHDALAAWMDERDLPGKGEPVDATFISGGSSNEIFEIRRGDAVMALRRPPRKVPEGRNETMMREFRVLEALSGTDVPHPEAIAGCDDPSVIGACFYLMGHIDGWSPMGMGDMWPEPFADDLTARKALGIQLVDGIARLSRVDWRAKGLEGFGKPDGFLERQADRWQSVSAAGCGGGNCVMSTRPAVRRSSPPTNCTCRSAATCGSACRATT
jgi:aminoglycoside phosphotransferase (APT) family kinase protein